MRRAKSRRSSHEKQRPVTSASNRREQQAVRQPPRNQAIRRGEQPSLVQAGRRAGAVAPGRATKQTKAQPRSSRLNQVLLWAGIVLVAALAALVADLLTRPATTRTPEPTDIRAESATPAVSQLGSTPLPSAGAIAVPSTEPCTAPLGWGVYQVRSGDTLFSLAQEFGTDVQMLKRVNCLETATIFTGQDIYVPWQQGLPTAETTGGSAPSGASAASSATLAELVESDRWVHMVLLGTDVRHSDPSTWRTDTMIITSVDLEDKTVRLIHIPRDLYVHVPGIGDAPINSAEILAELENPGTGPETVKQTIYQNLGIPIRYYAQVTFRGFETIIDKLGGLEVDVACPVPELGLTETGMLHMDGKLVRRYAARRETSSDFDRGIRQRQILMALKEQALTPSTVLKLPQLWGALADSYETDIPLEQVIKLAYLGMQIDSGDIVNADISRRYVRDWVTPGGKMVLLPREDEIQEFLRDVYSPIEKESTRTTGKTRVQISNGSQRNQADQLAAAALRRAGFKITGTGSASQRLAETQILIYKGDPTAGERIAAALQIPLSALQDYTAIPEPPDFSNPVDVRVILGKDYDPCWR